MPHHHTNGHSDSASQIRLLYVGEDLALIRFLRTAFHGPEYHVVSCPDRDSAERFIKSDIPYHLFIFDHEMRHRAAFELAQLVRSLKHRQSLPAMIVGEEAENSLNEFTCASGGDQYVQKNDSFSAIHKSVKRLLLSSTESAINVSGTASCPDSGS
jgi:DNA-binding response OmpR family regulator